MIMRMLPRTNVSVSQDTTLIQMPDHVARVVEADRTAQGQVAPNEHPATTVVT